LFGKYVRVLKTFFAYLVGLVFLPFYLLLRWMVAIKTPEAPADFVALVGHLHGVDLWPVLSMRHEKVTNVEALGWLSFGISSNAMCVVTVARCASPELAKVVENELRAAPQYTGVNINRSYVMGCTFSPANPDLEARVTAAFLSFGGAG
jgi:hypothetical protein